MWVPRTNSRCGSFHFRFRAETIRAIPEYNPRGSFFVSAFAFAWNDNFFVQGSSSNWPLPNSTSVLTNPMSTTSAQQSDDNETATIASTTGDVQVTTTQESAQIDSTELSGNAAPPEEQEEDGSTAPKKILCGVCSLNEPKYKCPRCYLP